MKTKWQRPTVDTEKIEDLLYWGKTSLLRIANDRGEPGRYTTFIHVKNNTGNVSQNQFEDVLGIIASELSVEPEELVLEDAA